MHDTDPAKYKTLLSVLRSDGFAFVESESMHSLLERHGTLSDWSAFAASWNDLQADRYLADNGRHRRRRHAVFSVNSDYSITREVHQPHYQSRDYNQLYGGIERWFEPIEEKFGNGNSLRCILHFCAMLFGALAPDALVWRAEVHQFRIEARPGEPGQPTPEGMHRDGVDYVLVLLIARRNIVSGTTMIHASEARVLGSFTLTSTFDAALVDDARVFHGVTPVEPQNATQSAYRDVLVVTFKRAG